MLDFSSTSTTARTDQSVRIVGKRPPRQRQAGRGRAQKSWTAVKEVIGR